MASSSSSSSNWRYHVFPSFSGEDVRKAFLSHFLKELERKGIETFEDHGIKRGETIGPELERAIKESRISIVVFSKNYASSSWCLNELLEIMKCRDTLGQRVMTVFYQVDPSDVRRQAGDFGRIFEKTCTRKTEEERRRWRRALTDAANIAGEDSRSWDNEAYMIEKIARDVSNELNSTPSRDFDNLVGIEAHIARVNSLLCLSSDEVRMVGIWGPAGIGKTTIARALYDRLSTQFQRSCFMEHVKGSCQRTNLDDYELKLHLQERFLSRILDQKDIVINHLGVVRERLENQRVLVILDDVDDIEQLDALVGQTWWFGSGSRIIVTTEDIELLKAYRINDIYEVNLPFLDQALQIFCQSAFGQNSPPSGFEKLSIEVVVLAGRLPLGLKVLGSSLRGMSKDKWILALPRLRTSLDGKIEKILRVGYDGLNDKDKAIFLHIACLFNGEDVDRVVQLLASDLNAIYGLKILANRSLIHQSGSKRVQMHDLLQQFGREVVRAQSISEPEKRQFLVDAEEICDVLGDETGYKSIIGISLNTFKIGEFLYIGEGAFKKMRNLQFLRIYSYYSDRKVRVYLPQGLENLPRKLRLLHWDAFPLPHLPSKFRPQCLVQLIMPHSNLEKLWEGIQALGSLREMDLSWSENLKEIPNLSEARNLERLDLKGCRNLETFPHIAENVREMHLWRTKIKEVPSWIGNCLQLRRLVMNDCKKLKHVSSRIHELKHLELADFSGCDNVVYFPKDPFRNNVCRYMFLPGEQVPEYFTYRAPRNSLTISLDGRTLSSFSRFKACFVLYAEVDSCWEDYPVFFKPETYIYCHFIGKDKTDHVHVERYRWLFGTPNSLWTDQLCILDSPMFLNEEDYPQGEVTHILFDFAHLNYDIFGCGVRIL